MPTSLRFFMIHGCPFRVKCRKLFFTTNHSPFFNIFWHPTHSTVFFQQVPSPPSPELTSEAIETSAKGVGMVNWNDPVPWKKNTFFCCSNLFVPKWSFQTQRRKDPDTKRWPPKGSGKPRFKVEPVSVTFFVDVVTRPKSVVMYRFSWDSVQSCTSRHRGKLVEKILGYTAFLGVYIPSNSMTTFQKPKKFAPKTECGTVNWHHKKGRDEGSSWETGDGCDRN